jgi:L-amino acid N-acyltransferase YncA
MCLTTQDDLPAFVAIYDFEVPNSGSTFDLEPPPLSYWQAMLASSALGHHLLVAVNETADSSQPVPTILGSAYSSAYRPRPAYDLTCETSI